MSDTLRYLEVFAVPPGEAPDYIKQAWIGVKLPDLNIRPSGTTSGVLSGKKVHAPGAEFIVPKWVAVEALAAHSDAGARAAAWWREALGDENISWSNFSFSRAVLRDTTAPAHPVPSIKRLPLPRTGWSDRDLDQFRFDLE